MRGALNLQWAFALIDGLAEGGAHRALISPGSRSTPLVLACERHPYVQTWVQVDERCAAFFALGMARYDLQPVILIATSGSGPAHWYPAVIEASESRIPLILLSADRPPEMQGWQANQTTDQTQLFGQHVRGFHNPGLPEAGASALRFARALGSRATRQAQWPCPGPVHINQPFREPLVPTTAEITLPALAEPTRRPPRPVPAPAADPTQLGRILDGLNGRPGIIVCGPANQEQGFAASVSALAKALGCPIFADPLSNLRFGEHRHKGILSHYDAFLRHPAERNIPRPSWVLRFGNPPVSGALSDYLEACSDTTTILAAPHGNWPDPWHQTDELVQASPLAVCNALLAAHPEGVGGTWSQVFEEADALAGRQDFSGRAGDLPFEGDVIEDLLESLPSNSLLFCGNSLPIRQIDTWSGTSSKPLRFLGNRGVSGIDGHASTLLGLAANAEGRPVVGLVGDIAFYHDMNGLLASQGRKAVIIVLNNGGGGIFGYLPQSRLTAFERYWLTPTGLDFGHIADLYRLNFQRVERQSSFNPAFVRALGEPGVSLIEVRIDRRYSRDRHQAYWDAVTTHRFSE